MWDFIQRQILKMDWLSYTIYYGLENLGMDLHSKFGTALHFFIYDVIKISILLCSLIFTISLIQSFFPPSKSKRIMGRFQGIGANILAALLGTVTPFCSCSSIPLFIGFTTAKIPIGVTFSFLISSPMVDLASLVLLMSIFGSRIALIYVLLGLVIAVFGGWLITFLKMEKYIDQSILQLPNIEQEEGKLQAKDRILFAKNQMQDNLKKVFPYILLGVGIGAFIHNWIPETWITNVLGEKNPFSVILATLVGIPMYGDIFGSIPIAQALLQKGASLGTILSFMMAITTISLPSLIMLSKVLKAKLLALFIGICSLGMIIVGYFFNAIQLVLM